VGSQWRNQEGTGTDGEKQSVEVVEINRPDGLVDIADLGLTLAEGKLLLAGVQQEIVAAQARGHAVRRPDCRSCGVVCCVKVDTGVGSASGASLGLDDLPGGR
jgi:hypothetical protein